MSDFYKCEHGSTLCGSCVRALKVQHTELESDRDRWKALAERMANKMLIICDSIKGPPDQHYDSRGERLACLAEEALSDYKAARK